MSLRSLCCQCCDAQNADVRTTGINDRKVPRCRTLTYENAARCTNGRNEKAATRRSSCSRTAAPGRKRRHARGDQALGPAAQRRSGTSPYHRTMQAQYFAHAAIRNRCSRPFVHRAAFRRGKVTRADFAAVCSTFSVCAATAKTQGRAERDSGTRLVNVSIRPLALSV